MALPQQLKNIVRFTGLAPNTPTSLPHGLNLAGRGVQPDILTPSATEGFTFTADATNITVQRIGDGDAVDVLCEYWHSYERSFGGSATTNLTPKPFVVGGGSALTPAFATTLYTIYARLTGSDVTGNGTLANPYRTFERAIRDVPLNIPPGSRYIVDITGLGTVPLPADFTLPAWKSAFVLFVDLAATVFTFQGAVSIFATPQLMAALPPADAVINPGDIASLTADLTTGLYTLVLNVPRASWAADALKGKFFLGADRDSQAVIASSTNTTIELTISDRFGFVPTGPFSITEPSVTFEGSASPGARGAFNVYNVDSIVLGGLKFVNVADPARPAFGIKGTQQPVLYLCDFPRANFDMGEHEVALSRCYVHTGPIAVQGAATFERCFMEDLLPMTNLGLVPQGFFINTEESIWDNCFPYGNQKNPLFNPGPPGFGNGGVACPTYAQNVEFRNAPGDGIYYTGGGGLIRQVRIANCGGNGMTAEKGSGTIGLSNVVGTGNAGLGLRLDDGAHVQVDAGVTVTGTGGDFQVGANAVGVWPGIAFNDVDLVTLSRLWQA